MRAALSACWNGLKIFLVFACCTGLFYYGILFIIDEYQGDERFEEPEGNAIKVFDQESDSEFSFRDRLWYLWQQGE
ncbi:hypothetical protein HNR44_000916 [Geomicrobium halophilum]|uniref:DUF4227 domain-containing protein n=1 Tax=Geomicrobium halophilum TaxID=549000 RepID=A0A841PJC2_9BACL|nr:DUF4227 family protein [Geomicrobium halophilum]MBB6448967.1 hypothetical protein [Geomicrobium halophilum]